MRAARLLVSRFVLPVMGALLIAPQAQADEPVLGQAKAPATELDRQESLTTSDPRTGTPPTSCR